METLEIKLAPQRTENGLPKLAQLGYISDYQIHSYFIFTDSVTIEIEDNQSGCFIELVIGTREYAEAIGWDIEERTTKHEWQDEVEVITTYTICGEDVHEALMSIILSTSIISHSPVKYSSVFRTSFLK